MRYFSSVVPVHGGRNDVVVAAGDEQQRGAVIVLEVDLQRRERIELAKAPGTGPVRRRHAVALVDRVGLFEREGIGEGVVEPLRRQRRRGGGRTGFGARKRPRSVHSGRSGRPYRAGVDAHAGGTQAAVEQQLDEGAAQRVAHDDRRTFQAADDAFVVVEDLGDVWRAIGDGSRRSCSTPTSMPGQAGAITLGRAL